MTACALEGPAMNRDRGAPTVLDDLRALVAALDRRLPNLERIGQHEIARDAAALRAEAVHRIAELERCADRRSA